MGNDGEGIMNRGARGNLSLRRRVGEGFNIRGKDASLDFIVLDVRSNPGEADIEMRNHAGSIRRTFPYGSGIAFDEDLSIDNYAQVKSGQEPAPAPNPAASEYISISLDRYNRHGRSKGRQVWLSIRCPTEYRVERRRYEK